MPYLLSTWGFSTSAVVGDRPARRGIQRAPVGEQPEDQAGTGQPSARETAARARGQAAGRKQINKLRYPLRRARIATVRGGDVEYQLRLRGQQRAQPGGTRQRREPRPTGEVLGDRAGKSRGGRLRIRFTQPADVTLGPVAEALDSGVGEPCRYRRRQRNRRGQRTGGNPG